jgi:hypothetical protein
MRLAGHVARIGEKGNAYRSLVGEPEGKRRRSEDNNNIDVRETVLGGRIGLIWLRAESSERLL